MTKLLNKELKLSASILTWIFLVGALMTFLPGYPILVGIFFVCFGIFQSFQNAREANDTLYSVLLPVRKRDFVSAKLIFTCFFEILGLVIAAICTLIRMTLMSQAAPYVNNAMMNATPVYLAFILLIYAAFNGLFLGGFFKTAYKIGVPLLLFGIAALIIVTIAEVLHHVPGLEFLNVPSGEKVGLQLIFVLAAAVICALVTLISYKASAKRFELIDL